MATGARRRDLANQARGRWGEEQAARWYRRHGYEVLDRNWRCAAGELDLVVTIDHVVVFVEVKARASAAYGGASAAVDHRKQRQVRMVAMRWLDEHPERRGVLRFDVVAITGTALEVFQAAF